MARRRLPSIGTPIVLASVTVPLAAALLVGWTLIFAQKVADTDEVAQNVWLLVLGTVAFVTIMSVLVMFTIFLVREIREVRRRDMFIDSVTHELKSPLASIKLCLQTMNRAAIDTQKREVLRSMMLEDVDRLSSFIDDVLQASRLAHDRIGMDLSEIKVRALTDEVVQGLSNRHRLSDGAIRVDVDPDLSTYTDRAALGVVIRNLLDNAVKYSEGDVDVVIAANENKLGGLALEVTDRGIGIPRQDLKRVFHRFYRVPSESVRARRGTGLGLFVVSSLVRNLGGRIEALSEGPGQGTTMRVSLPGPQTAPPRPA